MNYLNFCKTDIETEIMALFESGLSGQGVADQLNRDGGNVRTVIRRVKERAALQGYAPDKDMIHTAPDTHFVKGTSTLYKDGEVALQWVKTDKKMQDQYAAMQAAAEALKEAIPKSEPVVYSAMSHNNKLINQYTITDYHLGMLAWGEETRGEDWDLDIAENTLINWFEAAIAQSPGSETAIFAQIGDMLHWDGLEAVTPTHGHILDADSRFQKLIRVAIRSMAKITQMLLKKHKHVHIIHAQGNHDLASSAWLREMFDFYYKDEPRVTVDNAADPYYCYEFGNVSLFYHHGHRKNVSSIPSVFAAKFREVFGRTKFSYGHMGHRHSVDRKEGNLMIIEQHQTLASADAHSSGGGWISDASAQCITYHKDFGEVSRVRITPNMLK